MQKRLNFNKEKRLLKKQSFSLVFNENTNRVFYKNFLVLIRKNDLSSPRIGMVIPKKIVRKAVDRNLLKRKIRESFRKNQLDLPKIDMIFLLTKKAKINRIELQNLEFNGVWNLIKQKNIT